jgi:two-component system sensor histidine kinase UhpB
MLDYTSSELVGKTIWQLTHHDDVEENKRLFDRLMVGGIPFQLEKRLICRDGSILWMNVSVSPIMDTAGRPRSAVAVEVDITARKQAEEALQQLNLQLESRVEKRTAELQSANQALFESRRSLQILSQRLVEVQEEERRALARELHDRVGQTLAALNINMTIMSDQLLEDSKQRIGSRMDDSMRLVADAIALVRDVMTDLRPAVLDDYGLEAALQSYIAQYQSRYEMRVLINGPD